MQIDINSSVCDVSLMMTVIMKSIMKSEMTPAPVLKTVGPKQLQLLTVAQLLLIEIFHRICQRPLGRTRL
jgi:hypothetical protein